MLLVSVLVFRAYYSIETLLVLAQKVEMDAESVCFALDGSGNKQHAPIMDRWENCLITSAFLFFNEAKKDCLFLIKVVINSFQISAAKKHFLHKILGNNNMMISGSWSEKED